MAGGLLNNLQQIDISEQRRMPVDNIGADAIYDVTGETLQLYYLMQECTQSTQDRLLGQ
jgi:hypothetical protein